MTTFPTALNKRALQAGIAAVTTVAAVTAIATPAFAATTAVTLSSASVASGVSLTPMAITASAATAWLTGNDNTTTGATPKAARATLNTASSCPATMPATGATGLVDSGFVTKITNYKGMFTLDQTVAAIPAAKYVVCIYLTKTAGSALIANSTLTLAAPPTLGLVDPNSGPTTGGTLVTVTGAGLPTATTGYVSVTLGGIAVIGLKAIGATSFSFTTPTRAPSAAGTAQPLVVTTVSAGSVSDLTAYTYYSGITVTPNYGDNIADTPVDITGQGFSSLYFSTPPVGGTKAHVFLTKGKYVAGSGAAYTAGTQPITECPRSSVVTISDTEIICTLTLTDTLTTAGVPTTTPVATPYGAYTVTVVADDAIGSSAPLPSAITSRATFTVTQYN